MTPLRLAVVGVGDVAQRDYLPEFGRIADRATISVVCGQRGERAAAVAARFGVPRWSADYREVVGADDVDAVVNLTPIPLHHEITLAALRAGRHVYSEKPLASTAAEAQELHDEAERQGVVLVAAPSLLLFPQLRRVREIVASGELGTILAARAHAIAGPPPWAGYDSDPTPFFGAEGGPLVDMAVYPLHALTGLLGPATAVSALASRARDSFVVADGPYAGERIPVASDDSWQLLLRIGCLPRLRGGQLQHRAQPGRRVRAARGAAAASRSACSTSRRRSALLRAGAEGWVEEPVEHERDAGPDHILGVEHLLACVSSGERPVASAEHAIHVIDVIEAARRSVAEERTVAIAQTSRRRAGGIVSAAPLRLGVVGVGALMLRALLPHLTQRDVREAVVVEALCDPVLERAQAAAREYGVPKAYASLAELLADDDDRRRHDRLADRSALRAGPARARGRQARALQQDDDDDGRRGRRADRRSPSAKGLRIVASPGEVLRPQHHAHARADRRGRDRQARPGRSAARASARYHEQDEPERHGGARPATIDPSWYFRKPGGGPLYDMTVYALHGLTSVLGPAQRVTALSGMRLPEREFGGRSIDDRADDNTVDAARLRRRPVRGRVRHRGGTVIRGVRGRVLLRHRRRDRRRCCSNGEPFDYPGRELDAQRAADRRDKQMRVLPHVVGPHREIQEPHVFEDVMQLVDWVREGTPTPVTAEHARHVIDIIESAYRSAETGSAERLTTTFEWPHALAQAAP